MTENRTASPVELEMFKGEAETFTLSGLGDLDGKTMRFVVGDDVNPPVGKFKVEGGAIGTGQAADGIITVTVSASLSNTHGPLSNGRWWLWNTDDNDCVANGPFEIKPAVDDVA